MQPFEKIKEYSLTVCEQIHWKKAHPVIAEEIENHMMDQRDAYMAEGAEEAAATDQAIAQMGDPVAVGTALDHTHRPKPQWSMLGLTAALMLTGWLIRIFWASGDGQWLTPAVISMAAGLAMMAGAYFMDFTLIGKHPKTVYLIILALTAAAILLTPKVNGSYRYAGFLTLLFPLGYAAIVYAARNKGYWGIILCGLGFLLPAALAFLIPSTSGLLLFAVSGLVMLCLAISKNWFNVKVLRGYLLVWIPVVLVLLLVFAVLYGSYRWERLQAVFDPSSYRTDMGYIAAQVRTLLAGSSLIGHGAVSGGTSAVAWAGGSADYLLTYLIFNVGWVALIVIAGLLLFFIVKGFMLCFKQKSVLALLVSTSVMMTFTMQAAGYVMANLGLPLLAPISLPLISHGNMAAILNLTLIGMMLSVFRIGDIIKDKNIIRNPNFITVSEGKLIISLGKK